MIQVIHSYTVRASVDLYTPHAQRGLAIWVDCCNEVFKTGCSQNRGAVETILLAHSTPTEREQFGLHVEEL